MPTLTINYQSEFFLISWGMFPQMIFNIIKILFMLFLTHLSPGGGRVDPNNWSIWPNEWIQISFMPQLDCKEFFE